MMGFHDLAMWGHVKNIVHRENIGGMSHLKESITGAIESITLEILDRVWTEIEYRY
jgi:hypothetical protein